MKYRKKFKFFWQLIIAICITTMIMGVGLFFAGRRVLMGLEDKMKAEDPSYAVLWSDRLARYYDETGGWRGVEAMIESYPTGEAWGPWDEDWALDIIIISEDDDFIYATNEDDIGGAVQKVGGGGAIPIMHDGEEIGTLLYASPMKMPDEDMPPPNGGLGHSSFVIDTLKNFLFIEIGIIVLTVVIGGVISQKISKPMGELVAATRAIGSGDFDVRVPNYHWGEMHELSQAFNSMAEDLGDAAKDLYQAKEEAIEAQHKAEAANRAKSVFLANMSHELRTPLNAILGFTQLMERDPTITADQRENLETISRSGQHLLTLINDVLEMSKIEAGRTTLYPENFDLYHLLDMIEEMFRLRASEKGLQLLFERGPDVPQYVRTDEGKLRQVLINLLSNAVKFTEEGGVTVRIDAREQAGSDAITLNFEVEDTGAGISPEDLANLFDPFVQTASGQQSKEGTGLGLPISQQYVKLMGGELAVSSQVGVGSIFKFAAEAQVVSAEDVTEEKPYRKVVGLEPDQPTYRLLVVEDREVNRRLLIKLLNSVGSPPNGFEVREAANGKEGIEIWEEWEPHLIWMDMRMPVMDGHEATQRIKATTKGQATVIVALTASAFEEDRAVVLSEGCDDFVRKPFREAEIFDVLSRHLGVRFLYADETAAEQDALAGGALTPEALTAMPAAWIEALHEAAIQVDTDAVLMLVEQIPPEQQALSQALTTLIHDFRFDIIADLAAPRPGNEGGDV